MLLLTTVITSLALLTTPANAFFTPKNTTPVKDWKWPPTYGINCSGHWMNCRDEPNLEKFTEMIKNIDPDHHYKSMEPIACIAHDAMYSFKKPGKNAFCLFPKDYESSDYEYARREVTGIMGSEVTALLKHLVNHGCHDCGNVPIGYMTDDNWVSRGVLKADFVSHYSCRSEKGCIFFDPPCLDGEQLNLKGYYDINKEDCLY